MSRSPALERLLRWAPPLLVAAIAFSAGRIAMLPGVGYWDTAELQTVAPLMGTAHPTGFPTYVILGWLASIVLTPFGEPAFRMNLFAALCVAVAAAVTVDLVRALTRSVALGLLAGVGLALTDIVWSIGTRAEAHALHLALLVILFRVLIAWEERMTSWRDAGQRRPDRVLVAAAVVFGLAMGNHSLALLLAPAIGLFVLAVDPSFLRRPRLVAACAVALAATVTLVFLELPLRAGPFRAPLVYGHPETWDGFWYVALAEQFRGSLVGPFTDLGPKTVELVGRSVRAFGPLAALLPVAFVATAFRRPTYAILSGAALAMTCFFAASYVNADIERYYLGPAFIAWTWVAILAAEVARLMGPTTTEATSDAIHRPRSLVPLVLSVALLVPTAVSLPDRYATVDRSGDVAARVWVDRALARLAPDAVVVSWWSYSTTLWYAQHVEGRRPDITIIDDRTRLDEHLGELTDVIDANLPTRPVYVIRTDPIEIALLERRYVLEPIEGASADSLARVLARRAVDA